MNLAKEGDCEFTIEIYCTEYFFTFNIDINISSVSKTFQLALLGDKLYCVRTIRCYFATEFSSEMIIEICFENW